MAGMMGTEHGRGLGTRQVLAARNLAAGVLAPHKQTCSPACGRGAVQKKQLVHTAQVNVLTSLRKELGLASIRR